jgi:hypothetical protein
MKLRDSEYPSLWHINERQVIIVYLKEFPLIYVNKVRK